MSKLDELIQELCPNGVEYKELGDVVTFLNGRAYKQNELLDSGKYKVLRVGNFYTNNQWYYSNLELDDNKYCQKGDLLYTWAATIGPQIWNGEKVIYHYHIWKLIYDDSILNKHYLFHYLKKDINDISNSLTNSTMPHVSMSSMKKRIIPIPPLEVQKEIVRLLDDFTAKTEELQAELNKEYEIRKKQYEYYKRRLFDGTQNHTITTLQDICENCDSMRKPVTSGNRESGNIPYYGASGIVDYVKDYIFDGDYLLVSEDGANLVARSTPIAFSISGKTWVNNHAHVLKFNEYATRKYVEMYLNSIDLKNYITGAAQPKLNQKNLNKITIPLPSLVEQKQIVSILESFEVSYKKIISELTFELESRQKQYEYYRDKLLTFKELNESEVN